MIDLIEFLVEAGKRSGVIPVEIGVSLAFLFLGYKGYMASRDGQDIVENLVYAGSIAALCFGAGGILAVVIQALSR